jgi:hypothetical protein
MGSSPGSCSASAIMALLPYREWQCRLSGGAVSFFTVTKIWLSSTFFVQSFEDNRNSGRRKLSHLVIVTCTDLFWTLIL